MSAVRQTEQQRRRRTGVLLLLAFAVWALCSIRIYYQQESNANQYATTLISERASKLRQMIVAGTGAKLKSFQRISWRWDRANGTTEDLWRDDADSYLSQIEGLKTLSWVDAHGQTQWIEPASPDEDVALLNRIAAHEWNRATALAPRQDVQTLSTPLVLKGGRRGFLAYVPVFRNGQFDGYLTAVFSVQDMLQTLVREQFADDFKLQMMCEGINLFDGSVPYATEPNFAQVRQLNIGGQTWTMTLTPGVALIQRYHSALPIILLFGDLVVVGLLCLLSFSRFKARQQMGNLRRAIQLNSAILKSTANLIVATDPQGKIMIFNRAAEETLGYRAAEVEGRETPALFHDPDDVRARAAELSMELGRPIEPDQNVFFMRGREQGIETSECIYVCRDGRRLTMNLTVTSLEGPDGEFVGYLGISENITQRKQAERERQAAHELLRHSEATFRSAMQSASIGMALVSTDGRFIKVNSALCHLLGYEERELLRLDFQTITHPDDLNRDLELLQQTLTGTTTEYRMEKRYIHRDGRTIWAVLSVALVRDGDGQPSYLVGQVVDISEVKEIDRIKNEFISIVSHELRTPLTSIRGSLGILLGAYKETLPAKANRLMEIAHDNCERLIVLINDILDIDKIASGQMRFDLRRHQIRPLLQKALHMTEVFAQKFDVSLQMGPIDENLDINVDGDRFVQVLVNLISNAAKFSPRHGTVHLTLERRAEKIRVNVIDRGSGIPEEFRPRIFQKFCQADSSGGRRANGSGLGLHIARQIIDSMHGEIGFDTALGHGTTFWVDVPLLASVRTPATLALLQPSNRPSVLHVEDDIDVSRMLAEALQDKADFTVATDLASAEVLLRQRSYSLLLLDLSLPDGSGLDLLRRLPTLSSGSMPVVVLSADAPPTESLQNVSAVLIKTRVAEERIVQVIEETLERQSAPVAMIA